MSRKERLTAEGIEIVKAWLADTADMSNEADVQALDIIMAALDDRQELQDEAEEFEREGFVVRHEPDDNFHTPHPNTCDECRGRRMKQPDPTTSQEL